MSVEKVLAISGKPGLYELKLQTRAGFIAQSLVDGKKVTVGLKSNVSLLSEISIYTNTGEVKLFEVFARIAEKENNNQAITHKASNEELEAYFAEVLPTYDSDRVYHSDIKKVLNWYNILNNAGVRFQLQNDTPATEEAVVEDAEVIEEKPKAKKATKKVQKEEE